MTRTIFWNGRAIAFSAGDSIAGALTQAGVYAFGPHPNGGHCGVFCGIGQCQGCLVADTDGQVVEACLRPCVHGSHYQSLDRMAPTDA